MSSTDVLNISATVGTGESTLSEFFPVVQLGMEMDIVNLALLYFDPSGQVVTPPLCDFRLAVRNLSATSPDAPPHRDIRHYFQMYFLSENRATASLRVGLPIMVPEGQAAQIYGRGLQEGASVQATAFVMMRDRDKEPYLTVSFPGDIAPLDPPFPG